LGVSTAFKSSSQIAQRDRSNDTIAIGIAGKIASRPRPTLDEFAVDRITAKAEDHRLWRLQIPHRDCHKFLRHYDVRIGYEDLVYHALHVFLPGCPEGNNFQIAPFDPTQFAQTCSQGI
jgi:hypothetical protein